MRGPNSDNTNYVSRIAHSNRTEHMSRIYLRFSNELEKECKLFVCLFIYLISRPQTSRSMSIVTTVPAFRIHGGIELVSITFFQTTYDSQSALVSGNNFIFEHLYNPTPNQSKLSSINNALELVRSTFPSGSSQLRNAFETFIIPLIGDIIAVVVIDIEKIFKFFPLIQSMNPFTFQCLN